MKCELCGENPINIWAHLRLMHPDIDATEETWAAGEPVVEDDTLEPEDFA